MFEYFTVHSKKIQFISWKTDAEIWPNGNPNKLVKTKAEFFKDLLPGDIIELSFVLNSTSHWKAEVTAKAWRADHYLGERKDTFNMIAKAMECFNLKEID